MPTDNVNFGHQSEIKPHGTTFLIKDHQKNTSTEVCVNYWLYIITITVSIVLLLVCVRSLLKRSVFKSDLVL